MSKLHSPPLSHTVTPSLDSTSAVYQIDQASAEAAFAVIVLAFAADPAARWSWPRAEDYLRNMPLAAHAFGGKSFTLGMADAIDGLAGVSAVVAARS